MDPTRTKKGPKYQHAPVKPSAPYKGTDTALLGAAPLLKMLSPSPPTHSQGVAAILITGTAYKLSVKRSRIENGLHTNLSFHPIPILILTRSADVSPATGLADIIHRARSQLRAPTPGSVAVAGGVV